MFIDSDDGLPFKPSPSFFLAGLDIYDREETLGEELELLDPDNPSDREVIIVNYCLPTWKSYKHRYFIYQSLQEALEDPMYDFKSLFMYDPEAYSSFPSGWDEMQDTRVFFEDVFRLATIAWSNDLMKAAAEDISTW
ncbi:hypothetical protein [Pseudomonas sp. PS01303]|jgi:hypothetical protein|uniref:hypothetical protein n=1 Tax=Pseudomonas sp. PS01303 TaxID=2991439 RepID=UPI00249B42A3|nr:hypothetical protein [Pseudomonas sp. PS01303]